MEFFLMVEKPTYDELKERVQNLESQIFTQNRFQNISRTFFKISSAINTTSNLDELYKSIHGELSPVIDTTNFFIAIYDKTEDNLTFPYCVDSVDECYPPVIEISKTESLTAKVIRTGLPLLITKDEMLSQRQKSQRIIPVCTPSEIWLGVPLKIKVGIIGVMAVQSYDDANCYDQTDLKVMVSVADQVALAIENKRSEKTLRESEQRYRRLAENSPDMLYRISLPDGKYEYVSPAAKKIFGYPPETWYTNPLLIKEIMHLDFYSYFSDQWKKLTNGFVPPVYDYKIVHKDKSERWINQRNILVKDEHGQPVALEGVATDITNRRQIEEDLRNSETKHKALVNNIPGMIYRANPDWSAEIISGSESICGFTEKELNTKEKNWLSIIHHDDREKIFKKGSELPQAQKNLVQRYRINTKEGDIRWVEDRKTSLFSEKGDLISIDGIIFDITERKQVEENLKKSEELFKLITGNTSALVSIHDSNANYIFASPFSLNLIPDPMFHLF